MADVAQDELERSALKGLRSAAFLARETALIAKWHIDPDTGLEKPRSFAVNIALMHEELSEALRADRKKQQDKHLPHRNSMEVELADCLIRILEVGEYFQLDVAGAVIEKNRYNREREDHKFENRKTSGKSY